MINTICAVALLSTYFSYTNVNEFVEKITYDNRHFIQVSSPYNNSYFESNSSSNLKVGNETHFFPYGGSFSREYISFLKVYLPSYDSIIDATFKLYSADYGLSMVSINYYNSVDYNSTSMPYPSGSFGIVTLTNGVIFLDMTSVINSYINIGQTCFYLSISRSYSGVYGEFYNYSEANFNVAPELIVHTVDLPNNFLYGCALTYTPIYPPSSYDPTNPFYHNCYYYAINYYPDFPTTTAINYWNGEQYSIQFMEENVIPNFINKTLQLYSILLRPIDSYDSYVYNWEYRIAFRLKINLGTIDDYHFMRQSNTGSWCDKMMATCSSEHTNFNPTTDNWPYGFDSPTYYFAVSTL